MRLLTRIGRVWPVAAVALALAAPAAGASAPTLVPTEAAKFPDRAFVLSFPTAVPLDLTGLEVRENGKLVPNPYAVPARLLAASKRGIVLAIDASNSMRGSAIEGAIAAARAFATQRSENHQLALVVFNGETSVLLPFTSDQKKIDAALRSTPPLAVGTHIYDGIDLSLGLLAKAKIASGSIIVLSDGSDVGSTLTAAAVTKKAADQQVRIFSVGLRSKAFKPDALQALADGSRGAYSEATSALALRDIFTKLALQLSNEYVIRYKSLAGPGERVTVEVSAPSLPEAAKAVYVTPELALPPKSYNRSFADTFWGSTVALTIVSVICAGLVGLGIMTLLRPNTKALRERMAEFVTVQAEREGGSVLPERMLLGAERPLSKAPWWSRFKAMLEIAGIEMPAVQIVLWTIVFTIAVMTTIIAFLPWGFGFFGLGTPLVVRFLIWRKLDHVRRQFAEQLPDNLQVLASALRAGHSFIGALSVVVDDAAEPSRSEFKRVIADEQLGLPLDRALETVVERMANVDLEQVALVAVLQRETGGNTAEVLDRVGETIRERFELRRLIRTLTAQGRLSRWIVSLLPVFLMVAISLMNPDYMRPLYERTAGQVMLGVAAALVVAGSLVIRKIVNIRV